MSKAVPWYLYAVLAASLSVVVGVIWDISWHRSIGRDAFLTPAHLAIYLGGILAGCSCGWLVLKTTFKGTPEEKATGVSFWGFRGPLGAWVCIWGSFAMIVSAPFDDWWHNAYGLDVKVLSPPHTILALGFTGIQIGALLMLLARQNTTSDPRALRPLKALAIVAAGFLVTNISIMGFEYISFANDMHNARFYQVAAGAFPLFLVAAARASKLRWPATAAAGVYMGVTVLMIWILQLFPATPKLAPIYTTLTSMVPPPFPILLVVPALAVDVAMQRLGPARGWLVTPVAGLGFVALLLAVQWPFSKFLVSPASYGFFFGDNRWNYGSSPGSWRFEFWNVEDFPVTLTAVLIAGVLAMVSTRVGLWWGGWMARVQR